MEKIVLYNSEGDILWAIRLGENLYQVNDQWNRPIKNVSAVELLCIYHGIETVVDSAGRRWNLKEHSSDTRDSIDKVLEIIRKP